MGAIGSALLAKEEVVQTKRTVFRGFDVIDFVYTPRSFECSGCANMCEVVEIKMNGKVVARWGDQCGKWSNSVTVA
jgi:hypothetical protein